MDDYWNVYYCLTTSSEMSYDSSSMEVVLTSSLRSDVERHARRVVEVLRAHAPGWLTYSHFLRNDSTLRRDSLAYMLASLVEVGLVERKVEQAGHAGRPRHWFRWVTEQSMEAQPLGG